MKKIFIILFISVLSISAYCQDYYKITVNNVDDIVDKQVDDSIAVIGLAPTGISKIRVRYRSSNIAITKKMRRQFIIYNNKDAEVATMQMMANEGSVEFKLSAEKLKKQEPLVLYTIAYPTDPTLAARIKIRRVKLAIIEWR